MFRMVRSLAFVLCLSLLGAGAATAAAPSRTLIRLDISSPAGDAFVRENLGYLDVITSKAGLTADVAADARALAFLAAQGHPYQVIQENLEESLAYENKGVGFGIYHTYSESVAFVDSLRLLYPDVVSAKWSIGQTLEGRDIWAFRVSANPDVDENEPEILIDGLHHAREIMASEFPIMFAEYLASNYGNDPMITWLLDHRELYIIPIVNPDGFVYNEQTYPNGGGMWRKNRRNNGGGTYGVDINRNYPYNWGYDNGGSSPDPASETYRGPGPASELETQAITNFIDGREIRTHDTVHTYSNLTLYPWGYINVPTVDEAIFSHMAGEMTKFNGYEPGRPGAVLYDVNGGAFDWAYGDVTKHAAVFSFSNEIGTDGFWPAESRRGELFQENIWPHIYLMQVAGSWVSISTPVILNAAKSVLPGQSADLSFTVENSSVFESLLGVDLTVTTADPWVQLGAATRTIGSLASLASTDLSGDPIPFTVDAACPSGHTVKVIVVAHLADGDLAFPLSFTVGAVSSVFADDFEGGGGAWTTTGTWGVSAAQSHSPSRSLTDTPSGNYGNDSITSATLTTPVKASRLQFWQRYNIESGYDYGRVQVGVNGSWTTLVSYSGTQTAWQFIDLDLSAYAGQDVQVRFQLETDYSVVYDGWYIDDVTLLGDPAGDLPAVPTAVAPLAGAAIPGSGSLVVNNSSDPQGGSVVYGFRVYGDADCTQLVATADNQAEGAGQTSWTLPGLADGSYYWRAWAGAGGERSQLSAAEPFTVSNSTGVDDFTFGSLGLRVLDGVTGSQARLQLTLPGQQDVALEIFDARGARVRRLHAGPMAAGVRTLVWDGRDSSGRAAASGVYFVKMAAGADVRTGRVVIVR